jgi:GET complex subunit GET2
MNAAASSEQRATSHVHADPIEVDISRDDWEQLGAAQARRRNQQPTSATPPVDPLNMGEARLQQMMMGFDRQLHGEPAGGNPYLGGEGPGAEDPMMKMLSQMMGAGGQGPSSFGMPPSGAAPGQPQAGVSATSTRYSAIWRILHTILALGLSLYLVLTTSFSGTRLERERAAVGTMNDSSQASRSFFLIFATTEALLLTTRFFLDRGREPPSGILWTVTGLLPPPFKDYLETALRYGQMFTTFRADLLVCIFVLGLYSWIRTS